MSVAMNEITGDEIKSKPSTEAYENNWERIFGAKSYCPADCGSLDCHINKKRIATDMLGKSHQAVMTMVDIPRYCTNFTEPGDAA